MKYWCEVNCKCSWMWWARPCRLSRVGRWTGPVRREESACGALITQSWRLSTSNFTHVRVHPTHAQLTYIGVLFTSQTQGKLTLVMSTSWYDLKRKEEFGDSFTLLIITEWFWAHSRDGAGAPPKKNCIRGKNGYIYTLTQVKPQRSTNLRNTGLSMQVFLHIFSLFLFKLFLLDAWVAVFSLLLAVRLFLSKCHPSVFFIISGSVMGCF